MRALAQVRSGDKGGTSDLTVVAQDQMTYQRLRAQLTASLVQRAFDDLPITLVDRYELPRLRTLKFVLHGALGAGVTGNLMLDAHGKCLSSSLLALELPDAPFDRSNMNTRGTS